MFSEASFAGGTRHSASSCALRAIRAVRLARFDTVADGCFGSTFSFGRTCMLENREACLFVLNGYFLLNIVPEAKGVFIARSCFEVFVSHRCYLGCPAPCF